MSPALRSCVVATLFAEGHKGEDKNAVPMSLGLPCYAGRLVERQLIGKMI